MPWKLNHSELNPQVEDENNNYVCQVWGTGTSEGRRNARLICAAPEMYRLLRRALPRVDTESRRLRAEMERIIESIDEEGNV